MKRRPVIYFLIMLITCILVLESALRLFDPSGIFRYYADYTDLMALSIPAPDGYRFVPGYHTFRQYHAVIGIDGLRGVPESAFAPCRIVFVGDSVTFGMGSDVSFVDVLAPNIPASVINAGLPGYSAGNIARLIEQYPAQGYIWLIIQNDDEPPYRWQRGAGVLPAAVNLYLGWLFPGGSLSVIQPHFAEYADTILSRSDVLAFVFEGQKLTPLIEAHYPAVQVIPHYIATVSRFDAHPSEQGAVQIAGALRQAVMSFTRERCTTAG